MRTHRSLRRTCQGIAIVGFAGLVIACGGSDDAAPAAEPAGETTPAEPAEEPSEIGDAAAETETETETEADSESEAVPPAASAGAGSATLMLENGESFEFSVLCALESQIAAGSEILFNAVSYDDPGLDITQFGNEGPVTDIASVDVYDASYETLWAARSDFEPLGGGMELSLDGSTITGNGMFFPADDIAGTAVAGTIVANC
jgi:hypothetical protein